MVVKLGRHRTCLLEIVQETLVNGCQLRLVDASNKVGEARFHELSEDFEAEVAELRSGKDVGEVVLVVENVDHAVLLQVLFEVLVVELHRALEVAHHIVLEELLLCWPVNVYQVALRFQEAIQEVHLRVFRLL